MTFAVCRVMLVPLIDLACLQCCTVGCTYPAYKKYHSSSLKIRLTEALAAVKLVRNGQVNKTFGPRFQNCQRGAFENCFECEFQMQVQP